MFTQTMNISTGIHRCGYFPLDYISESVEFLNILGGMDELN